MLEQQNTNDGSVETLIDVTDEAQVALIKALPEDSEAPHTLRLHFHGYG